MTCHCRGKNLFRAGWMMRYGSIVPTREHKLVKEMLQTNLRKFGQKDDGELKEFYLCQVCATEWQLVYEMDRLSGSMGVKVLTKIKEGKV